MSKVKNTGENSPAVQEAIDEAERTKEKYGHPKYDPILLPSDEANGLTTNVEQTYVNTFGVGPDGLEGEDVKDGSAGVGNDGGMNNTDSDPDVVPGTGKNAGTVNQEAPSGSTPVAAARETKETKENTAPPVAKTRTAPTDKK